MAQPAGFEEATWASRLIPSRRWPTGLGCTVLGSVLVLMIYRDTVMSMVDIWSRSDTFAHGFLIAPISAWLVYRRREVLAPLTPAVDYWALGLLFLCGLLWFAARIAGILFLEQYALVLMIPAMVWLMLGWQIVREIAFPLGFLLFAVPNGDFLVPPMMNFTADFTVKLLQLTGIPVYREGTFFSIPSGDWSVVEGCSGLRYLIASITLGFLYAYLTYSSFWRRFLFVCLSVIFPVIANGLRAYMIVMIAHLSNMKLALGVDHFIYGWIFFGLVMLLMFWLGSFMAESGSADAENRRTASTTSGPWRIGWRGYGSALVLALAFLWLWPTRAAYVERLASSQTKAIRLALPQKVGAWESAPPQTDWSPAYQGASAELERTYSDGKNKVTLFVLYYRNQAQGAELANTANILVRQKHGVWRMPSEEPVRVRLNGKSEVVLQGQLQSSQQHLLTWRWSDFNGTYTVSNWVGKLIELRDKMLGTVHDAVGIIVATEITDDSAPAAAALQSFLDAVVPELERRLVHEDESRSS